MDKYGLPHIGLHANSKPSHSNRFADLKNKSLQICANFADFGKDSRIYAKLRELFFSVCNYL